MPAPFAAQLCGYRPNGNPNTSDNGDSGSIALGHALFAELQVPQQNSAGKDPGALLETAIVADLKARRPDLVIERSRSATEFNQYQHLDVYPKFRKVHVPGGPIIRNLAEIAASLPDSPEARKLRERLRFAESSFETQDEFVALLKSNMPEESFLKIDITAGEQTLDNAPSLLLGLSAKWSLRTDRAQDCVSQGSKLASQRRGSMPHFAVITMEPRPAMLRILADGSGAIDYVYHLDLPALARAIEREGKDKGPNWSPRVTFDRLMKQRRLRDYDELVREMVALPYSTVS
ncbi:NgoMIV family type II restriction endonuclease [Rhodoglobus sp.]